MFSPRRSAQVAAYFAVRQGGSINVLKLTKLVYLADRESISRHGMPILFDRPVSMPHGPVLSRTLNLTNGTGPERQQALWDEWFAGRANYEVHLHRRVDDEDLDELSEADLEVLHDIWRTFGHWGKYQLVDYTHKLPEWQDPQGSMIPITDVDQVAAILPEDHFATRIADDIAAARDVELVVCD